MVSWKLFKIALWDRRASWSLCYDRLRRLKRRHNFYNSICLSIGK